MFPSGKNTNNSNLHKYSTTEHIVGTWIDGKPIYERVYQGLTPSTFEQARVWTRYQILPDDVDISFIVEGFYKDINNACGYGTNFTVPLPFSGTSNQLGVSGSLYSNIYTIVGSIWRIIQGVDDVSKRQLAFLYNGGDAIHDYRDLITERAFSQNGAKPLQYNIVVRYTKTTD